MPVASLRYLAFLSRWTLHFWLGCCDCSDSLMTGLPNWLNSGFDLLSYVERRLLEEKSFSFESTTDLLLECSMAIVLSGVLLVCGSAFLLRLLSCCCRVNTFMDPVGLWLNLLVEVPWSEVYSFSLLWGLGDYVEFFVNSYWAFILVFGVSWRSWELLGFKFKPFCLFMSSTDGFFLKKESWFCLILSREL